MVPEKGILPACEAVARILPDFSDWVVDVAGGKQFKDSALSDYERHVRAVLAPLGSQARHHGFISGDSLARLQAQAEIAIVPSLWQEPAGLTVLEALCHGCALITTDRGGIPETASGRADVINLKGKNLAETLHSQNLVDLFAKHLESLLHQPEKRRDFQKRAWEDYPFSAANMAENADKYRISMAC